MAQPQHYSTAFALGYPDMLECGNLNGPLAAVESRTHFGAPATSLHITLVLTGHDDARCRPFLLYATLSMKI